MQHLLRQDVTRAGQYGRKPASFVPAIGAQGGFDTLLELLIPMPDSVLHREAIRLRSELEEHAILTKAPLR